MATIISHGVAAYTLAKIFPRTKISRPVCIAGILLSMLPDADVIGFSFGISYDSVFGHRGFTHSIIFALVAGILCAYLFQRKKENDSSQFISVFLYLFLATLSHGILDAVTSGGRGVGFFIPINNERYFFPFRPVLVSPIGISNFFSGYGLAVIKSEIIYIWIPCLLLGLSSLFIKKITRNDTTG